MKGFFFLMALIAVGSATAFSPKAQEGLNALHDFFGGFGSHSGEFEGHSGEFKGHSGEIGIENFGGLGALGNMFGVGNVFNQVFGSWSKMFGQIMSGDIFGALFSAIKGIVDNILSIFGGLGGNSRLELNTALSKTGNVFASTMKMKLNPQVNHQAIKQEILAVQKVMETHHSSANELVSSIKVKAPKLSSAMSDAFVHAKAEMNKHVSALGPEAKKGVEKMRLQVVRAKFDIGNIMNSMFGFGNNGHKGFGSGEFGKGKKGFFGSGEFGKGHGNKSGEFGIGGFNPLSIVMSIFNNIFSLFRMFF